LIAAAVDIDVVDDEKCDAGAVDAMTAASDECGCKSDDDCRR
jgi:hypothetical protein